MKEEREDLEVFELVTECRDLIVVVLIELSTCGYNHRRKLKENVKYLDAYTLVE